MTHNFLEQSNQNLQKHLNRWAEKDESTRIIWEGNMPVSVSLQPSLLVSSFTATNDSLEFKPMKSLSISAQIHTKIRIQSEPTSNPKQKPSSFTQKTKATLLTSHSPWRERQKSKKTKEKAVLLVQRNTKGRERLRKWEKGTSQGEWVFTRSWWLILFK